VLQLESLKIYDANGQPRAHPTADPAIMRESNSDRYQRIAAISLGNGDPLVKSGMIVK
jgi:hypothetical protein